MRAVFALACIWLTADGPAEPAVDRPPLQPAKKADSRQEFPFLWTGMKNHRQRLRSGIVRMSGRLLEDDPNALRLEGEVRIFSAFDFGEGKMRFDRTEPRAAILSAGAPGSIPRWSRMITGGKFVRVPGKTIYHVAGDVLTDTHVESANPPVPARPWDVRGLGLYHWLDLRKAADYDDVVGNWEKVAPEEVVDEGRGIHRIGWTVGSGIVRRTLWLDETKGFAPIRFELRWKDPDHPGVLSEPKAVCDVTWAESGGVWVPTTYRIEDRQSVPRTRIYELALEWESVNEPVPADLFTLEGMKLDPGNILVDNRLGKPIVVGKINERRVPVFSGIGRPGRGSVPTFGGVGAWNRRIVLAVNVVLLLMVLGYALYRDWDNRRRRLLRGDPPSPAS